MMENEMGGGIALRKCLKKEIEVFKKHSARVKIGYMMLLKHPKSAVIKNDIKRIESLATLIDRSLLRGDEHRALLMLVLLRKHIRSLSALL